MWELNLLGVTYDSNFTTAPYLRQLASDAKTRAAIISCLSYSMPHHLLKVFTHGLLVGKIMAAVPASVPFRINHEDKGAITLTDKINCSIKSASRTITRISLKDKIPSEIVLQKAGLRSLNEMVASFSATMVWRSKARMDPLGSLLFPTETNSSRTMSSRSQNCNKARLPAPGNDLLAANLLARAWNEARDVQNATNLGAAKLAASKWARSLQFKI